MAAGRHYLDHASLSPLRPEGTTALLEAFAAGAGAADPGRVHTDGRVARALLEDAREQVADLLGARPREVVFTSGGTEAINTAVWMASADHESGPSVCAAVEHSAVRDACARAGEVLTPAVDTVGRVTLDAVADALGPSRQAPRLVCLQWANHEVGTLQPVQEVVAWCRERGWRTFVDACAAAGHVPIEFGALGADLLAVSAPKLGGPPGMGALLVRRGLRLPPLLVGGEQERARRGGLENVPSAVAFGAVASHVRAALDAESEQAVRQTGRLLAASLGVAGVTAYGDTAQRVPHIVCLGVEGVEAEAVLLGLDQAGIAAHSGSACSSETLEPSPVLEAMGVAAERSLRLSVGWSTTDADIDAAATALPAVIDRLRRLGAEPPR